MIIKLTRDDGNELYIIKSHIAAFYIKDRITRVLVAGDSFPFEVKETPEEIHKQMIYSK